MTRRRRAVGVLLGLVILVALEEGAALLRPETAPLRGLGDALLSLALLSPLALIGAGHRLGPVAMGSLGIAALGPHAARAAGGPGHEGLFLLAALALLGLAWRWPRLGGVAPLCALLLAPLPTLLRPERPAPPAPAASSAGPELLLVTVDTLRADAGLALPGEGWLVVDSAISAAPWTLPAMDSLMTGAAVRRHRGGLPAEGGYTRPGPEWPRLAERLSEAGYATAAFVSNPHLRATLGFDRGFGRFEHADAWAEPHYALHALFAWRRRLSGRVERLRHQRDALLVDAALRWWAQPSQAPRFAWVHLLLPHEYTRDPQPRPPGFDPEDPDQRRAAYAANVAATGETLRRLIEGVGPEVRVVVTADHGESLGEQGRWGHGSAFVDAQLHVPLALRGFGERAAPRRPVALTELAETLVSGDPARLLQGRAVVEVGGLREDAGAFALRVGPDDYSPRPPPQGPGPATQTLDPELRRALEALGYVEP
ncbi:MAG: sulfatase-like hydrolase/transferase [Alphaproteobacteria bacterium]|nr:sulfatase-like hydrolase/transferase [Alphaproteobacteria bacterium]MCB9794429.1 sulfatase-like hydrolase/transferase [Alphaproteobacteria bacterium]